MAFKIKVGCRILKILVVGYGMKLSLRDRDSFLFIGGMWDIYLKAGCRMTQIKTWSKPVPFQTGSGIS